MSKSVHDWIPKMYADIVFNGEPIYWLECSKCGARRYDAFYVSGDGWERKGSPHCNKRKKRTEEPTP